MKPPRKNGPLTVAAILLSLCLNAAIAFAQDPAADCDRLPARRPTSTATARALPTTSAGRLAVPACEQAAKLNPGVARFSFQLARALSKAGRWQEALLPVRDAGPGGYARRCITWRCPTRGTGFAGYGPCPGALPRGRLATQGWPRR